VRFSLLPRRRAAAASVEHDHVEALLAEQKETFLTADRDRRIEALGFQPALERACGLGVVLDEQRFHQRKA
jgi:hypothetical protein